MSGPRPRPGWTRYQCPSSMASVTDPRRAAPEKVRAMARAWGPPSARAAATRPTTPMTGATRSSTGGNSGPVRSSDSSGPVDAGHGRHPGAASLLPVPLAGHAGLAPDDGHDQGDAGAGGHQQASRRPAPDPVPSARPAANAPDGQDQVHAAQQPAVADADLAPAGGHPAEEQATDSPLQQHGGGAEADHGPSTKSRRAARANHPGRRPVERRQDGAGPGPRRRRTRPLEAAEHQAVENQADDQDHDHGGHHASGSRSGCGPARGPLRATAGG